MLRLGQVYCMHAQIKLLNTSPSALYRPEQLVFSIVSLEIFW
jgi:hypothetical protein